MVWGRVGVLCFVLSLASCGGGGGSGSSGSSLAGVWDGVGTRFGQDAATVTVTIDAHQLVIDNYSYTLVATADGDDFLVSLVHLHGADRLDSRAHRLSPPAANLGSLPINISGQWQALDPGGDPSYGCLASLDSTNLNAACQRVTDPWRLPPWLPSPENVTLTGTRTASAPSIFGDLGGTWHIDQAGVGSCTVQFHDNVMDAVCAGSAATEGGLHVEISDGLLSGSTSEGVEFSAHRR